MINPATLDAGVAETTAPAAAENTTKTPHGRGASVSKFTIAGDKINLATVEMPERERIAIRWAADYCRARNLSHHDLAEKLLKPDGKAYSGDSVYHMFTGGRDVEQLANMIKAIERIRETETERAEQTRVDFIETLIARRISSLCRKAFLRQKMAIITGNSQIGKTWALEDYARKHNHGETKYVRMPPKGAYGPFLHECADVVKIPITNNSGDLRRRIIDAFDSQMLLIIDECEEAFDPVTGFARGEHALNFVREIHDKKKCGVVLAGADAFKRHLLMGRHAKSMERIVRRSMAPLQLPNMLPKADLALFAAEHGLPPIVDQDVRITATVLDFEGQEKSQSLTHNPLTLQTDVNQKHGLGRWVMILQDATEIAREKRRAVTWGLVIHAWHQFEQDEQFAAQLAEREGAS